MSSDLALQSVKPWADCLAGIALMGGEPKIVDEVEAVPLGEGTRSGYCWRALLERDLTVTSRVVQLRQRVVQEGPLGSR